jgi:hypothetical protein
MTTELNWRAFSRIPYTPETHALLAALGLEVPPEGVPDRFHTGRHDVIAEARPAAGEPVPRFLVFVGGTSWVPHPPAEVAKAFPFRTPSGDAIRQWLAWHGWNPPAKGNQIQPNP